MQTDNYNYPKRFIKVEYTDAFDEVIGYAPVRCLLFSETKVYFASGVSNMKYNVSSELVFSKSSRAFIKKDDCTKHRQDVYDIYNNYEDCKQACMKENDIILSNKGQRASEISYAWNLVHSQSTSYADKIKNRYKDVQNAVFKYTDKLYAEKSKSLDGSKAKQVVQKVKNNNKENQGK